MTDLSVRLLFVDEGSYHNETVRVPAEVLEGHERLIDALREESAVLKQIYLDVDRLCAAWVVEVDGED